MEGRRSLFVEGSVFGWYIDQVVDILHGQLGKRPAMWSPLHWDPAAPPAKLVTSRALLNLWTGDLNALAYNITLKGTNELVTSVGWYLPSSAYTIDPKDGKNIGTSLSSRSQSKSEKGLDIWLTETQLAGPQYFNSPEHAKWATDAMDSQP